MSTALSRTTVLIVVSAIEIAVILFFAGRWYSRKHGWRKVFQRLYRYARETGTDLLQPVVKLHRFGRDVRLIAAQLADPNLAGELDEVSHVVLSRLVSTPDCHPYAVRLSRTSVSIAVAGRHGSEPEGFRVDTDGWWTAPRQEVNDDPELITGYVAVGCERGGVTFLDLLQAPGVLEITGPKRFVNSLLWAVSGQLTWRAQHSRDLEVILADGLHPGFRGPRITSVLNALADRRDQDSQRFTVLLCGQLTPEEADLVTTVTRDLPLLRVVVAGPYSGRRWCLPVGADGLIDAPTLGLLADSAPVERGVALALKRRARPTPPAPPRPNPAAQEMIWDLDEPEPISPYTTALSLSAVNARGPGPADTLADAVPPDQASSRR